MFFNTEVAGLINLGNNLPKIEANAPPDIIIFFIYALLNFISVDMLFSMLFLNLVVCFCIKNNS